MDALVSFIIPVYNGEKYIEDCVKSIINQNYHNWELLIVDDGSQDQTYEICDKLSKRDNRINVFSIENKGVSNARNYGLSKASGQWVMFVDADDTIESFMISNALSVVRRYKVDTVCMNGVYKYGNYLKKMPAFMSSENTEHFIIEDKKMLIKHLYGNYRVPYLGDYYRAVWGKLLSARIIKDNNLQFPDAIKIGEDALFLVDYFANSNKVYFLNENLYRYSIDSESVTRNYKENFLEYQLDEFECMIQKLVSHNCTYLEEGIYFWHKAEKDLILNELKKTKSVFGILKKLKPFLKNKKIYLYMKMFDNGGIKSHIRTLLFKVHFSAIAAFIDIIMLKKRSR